MANRTASPGISTAVTNPLDVAAATCSTPAAIPSGSPRAAPCATADAPPTIAVPCSTSLPSVARLAEPGGEAWGRVFRAGSARADGPWLAAACAVAALGVAYARPFDMKYGEYGTPVLSVAAALAWAHVVFVLSGWLARIEALRRVVAPLGRASLVILFLHRLIVLELHGLPDAVVVAAATGLPFLAWLAIRRCPSPLRQALLGERPGRVPEPRAIGAG